MKNMTNTSFSRWKVDRRSVQKDILENRIQGIE